MPKLRYLRDLTIREKLVRRLRGGLGFGTMENYRVLLSEWRHNIEADYYSRGSSTPIIWVCAKDSRHSFLRPINRRTNAIDNGSKHLGCPYCSGRKCLKAEGLTALFPSLLSDWIEEANGSPDEVNPRSRRTVLWICPTGHIYACTVDARTQDGQGCPECYSGRRVNMVSFPELAKQLMTSEKNLGYDPRRLPVEHKVWWRCVRNENHDEFYRSVAQLRQTGAACPQCRRKDAATLADFPVLLAEFDRKRNGKLEPRNLLANSSTPVFWLCPKHRQHPFKTEVWKRCLRGDRCPYCSHRRAYASNCLANTHPAIARELHPTKNGRHSGETLLATSTIACVFVCDQCGYEYRKQICTRTKTSTCCPQCQDRNDTVLSSDSTVSGFIQEGTENGVDNGGFSVTT